MSFSEDIDRALKLLRARGRVSRRAIALELGIDAAHVQSICDEIVDVLQLASDDGKGILTALSPDDDGLRPHSRSMLREERAARAAERRLLTFMFCDVASSTPLATRLDPEDLRELMLKYQSVCSTAIERYEGHISQWVGDGAFTYFGFPAAHDDDAVRAVHAALAIVEAVSGIPAAADGTKLAVRVGVHTGWAVVGDLGGRNQNETLAFGEAPNICARIEARADPNTVAVSETTYALAEGFFAFGDLGEFELKGVDRPIRLHRAGAPTGATGRFEVVRDQGLMPLVDRVRERELLSAGWRGCQIGDGPALLIEGEAGIGKSRIVHFVSQLVLRPAQILELRASPYHRWSSSRAVSDAFRRFWGLDALAEVDCLESIASRLDALQFGEPFALPLLADFLDVKRPESAELTKMAPPQIRSLTFEVICNLVRRISETAPLLVVIEDMHWLDPSSDELVRLMLQRRHGARTLFVMTARPEYMQSAAELPGVELLVLEGLRAGDSIELARLAMARDPNAADMAERIATRSDGNPLFIEELTRAVPFVGAGLGGQQAQIPYTLQSTLRARLDSVGFRAREVAEWLAVIGGGFDRSLLTAASGLDQATISAGLESLVRSQLLRRVSTTAADRYEFRHALQQEAAAQGMLRSVARARHLAVAHALLKEFPDLAVTEPELIAQHFGEAGEFEKELHHRILAAERAVASGAYREALAEIDRCVEVLNSLQPSLAREKAELRVRLAQGGVYLVTKGQGSVEAKDAFDQAFSLTHELPRSPEITRALFGLWTFYFFRGDVANSVVLAQNLLAAAEDTGAPESRMIAHFACSASEHMGGHFGACVSHADAVLELYDPKESAGYIARYAQDPRVTVMTNACIALAVQGQVDRARKLSEETVSHALGLGHEFVLSIALQIPAFLAVHLGDADAAMRAALEWMTIAERQENPVYRALAASVIAWARAKGGERDALMQLRGIREGFRAQGVALTDALFVTMLADAALALRDVPQGQEILGSFEGAARGARTYEAEHKRLSAALSLLGGAAPVDARRQLESALTVANEQGASIFALRAALDLARVLERLADREAARAIVLRARATVTGDCPDGRAADQWLLCEAESGNGKARAFDVDRRDSE